MHFCGGGDLFDLLESNHAFPEHVASHVFKQLLKAVHHGHTKGIIHRDLKPANIVITEKIDQLHPMESMHVKLIG